MKYTIYEINAEQGKFVIRDERGEIVFYSNDGYITRETDLHQLKNELVMPFGVMEYEDILEWQADMQDTLPSNQRDYANILP